MKRKIIEIDEEKCTGCGECIPNCPEGALQIIDGKVRLISDLFCDGLGACIGSCPAGAITVIEREAELYDESKTMENIVKYGENTIKAHLKHLQEHGETEFLHQALEVLKEKGIDIDLSDVFEVPCCPGMKSVDRRKKEKDCEGERRSVSSQLRQWPIQLHLVNPNATYFNKADLIVAADCTAYACGNFHQDFLKGKSLIIACPKLDQGIERYIEKMSQIIKNGKINTITAVIMEVPCCSGLLRIIKEGIKKSGMKVPVKKVVIGLEGNILSDEWV